MFHGLMNNPVYIYNKYIYMCVCVGVCVVCVCVCVSGNNLLINKQPAKMREDNFIVEFIFKTGCIL